MQERDVEPALVVAGMHMQSKMQRLILDLDSITHLDITISPVIFHASHTHSFMRQVCRACTPGIGLRLPYRETADSWTAFKPLRLLSAVKQKSIDIYKELGRCKTRSQ